MGLGSPHCWQLAGLLRSMLVLVCSLLGAGFGLMGALGMPAGP